MNITMYRVRLDYMPDIDFIKLFREDLFAEATELLVVHHVLPHGNPHYHAYVSIDVRENTIRQRIKRKGFVASNFSLKKCDLERKDEYIQYLYNQKHGNIVTDFLNYNVDSEYLHRLQVQAKDIADEFAHRHSRKRSCKPTIYELAEEVSKIHRQYVRQPQLESYEYYDYIMYEAHLQAALHVCKKYRQGFEEHYLRRLVTTAMATNEKGLQHIVNKIMKKEFPDNY